MFFMMTFFFLSKSEMKQQQKTGVIPKERLAFYHGITQPSLERKWTSLPDDHKMKPLFLCFPFLSLWTQTETLGVYKLKGFWNTLFTDEEAKTQGCSKICPKICPITCGRIRTEAWLLVLLWWEEHWTQSERHGSSASLLFSVQLCPLSLSS